MCGGSGPEPIKIPDPQPLQELPSVLDEISRVKMTSVRGRRGEREIRIERLPADAETQRLLSVAKTMIATNTNRLKTLLEISPGSVVNYQPYLESLRGLETKNKELAQNLMNTPDVSAYVSDIQATAERRIEEDFNNAIRANNEYWNRVTGGAGGTYADSVRNELLASKEKALQDARISSRLAGSQLAALDTNTAISRNLAASGLAKEANQASLSLLEAERQRQGDTINLQNIEQQRAGLGLQVGQGIEREDYQRGMASLAPQIGLQSQANLNTAQNQQQANQIATAQANYAQQVDSYNRGNELMNNLMGMAGTAAGYYLGGKIGGAGGVAGAPPVNIFKK